MKLILVIILLNPVVSIISAFQYVISTRIIKALFYILGFFVLGLCTWHVCYTSQQPQFRCLQSCVAIATNSHMCRNKGWQQIYFTHKPEFLSSHKIHFPSPPASGFHGQLSVSGSRFTKLNISLVQNVSEPNVHCAPTKEIHSLQRCPSLFDFTGLECQYLLD